MVGAGLVYASSHDPHSLRLTLALLSSEQGEVYCAVKVLTQNATLGVASENPAEMSYEAIVLNEIGEDRYSEHPALKHCIVVWETFIAYSQIPAVHLCIVMRPCAGTLRELQCSLTPKIFPFGTVKRVIRQTLIALKFFHEDLQFIHGGTFHALCHLKKLLLTGGEDVQANNLIVDFYPGGDYEDISRRIHEYINMHPAETHVSGPSVPVQSQPLGNLGRAHKLNELNVRLSDYGSGAPPRNLADPDVYSFHAAIPIHMAGSGRPLETPLHSRAPEVLLGQPFSTAVDIWAVGCMVCDGILDKRLRRSGIPLLTILRTTQAYALLFDRPLFLLNVVEKSKLDLVHLSEMIQYLGPFPPPVVSKDQRRNFFDKTGKHASVGM